MKRPLRLHLGCGPVIHPGWVNVDVQHFSGVDCLLDARDGLPFARVDSIFSEHFLEHLTRTEGFRLLRECRRVLTPEGVLRISTPNLDWAWATAYRTRWQERTATSATIDVTQWTHGTAAAEDCLALNRSFYGWGHRFLYNRAMLEISLRMAGFGVVEWSSYGESRHRELAGLERHERYDDSPELPHLLVAEAHGAAEVDTDRELERQLLEYDRDAAIA